MAGPDVIIFDANETLFDLAPLKASVAKALGGRTELAPLWFSTLLHHSLAATIAGRYHNLDEIGAACLRMLAATQGIEMDAEAAREHLAPMRSLPPHPDVVPALSRLRSDGYRLAILTNSPKSVLADQVDHAGLAGSFVALLSVEEFGLYKPHPDVYRGAARRLGVAESSCLLVAAHGWDVAGASWAGLKSAFLARPGHQPYPLGHQPYPLGPEPDLIVDSLEDLPDALAKL